MKFVIFIFAIFLSTKSYAAGICDDRATLTNLWNTKYQQLVQSPDAHDINNPRSYTHKIAKALCFLENNGLPAKFNFFNFFRDFVTQAYIKLDNPSRAFAKTSGLTIEIYSPYFDEDPIMEYARASILVHEARHLEMKVKNIPNNNHVVCRNGGDLDGLRNCDAEFVANWQIGGATSFEVMFFRKLYEESTLSLNKKHLRDWIVQLLDNSFNTVSPELYERFTRLN